MDASTQLYNLGTTHPNTLSTHKLCNKYLDTYAKLINDSNVKVAI
jgi:hypothetical protein